MNASALPNPIEKDREIVVIIETISQLRHIYFQTWETKKKSAKYDGGLFLLIFIHFSAPSAFLYQV